MRSLSRFVSVFAVLSLLEFGACSKPPEIPPLYQRQATSLERIVLDEKLSTADFRSLFQAVNRKGKLDALKPFLEAPSDAELDPLVKLASKWFIETAFEREGFISGLSDATRRKNFTLLYESIQTASRRPGFASEVRVLGELVAKEEFPRLVQWDAGFLAPDWTSLTQAALQSAKLTYRDKSFEFPPGALWARDFKKFFAEAELSTELLNLLQQYERDRMGFHLLTALSDLRPNRRRPTADGIGFGVAKLLTSKFSDEDISEKSESLKGQNKWQLILEMGRLANGPTKGLLKTVQEKLKVETDPLDELAVKIQPMVITAIGRSVRSNYSDLAPTRPPTEGSLEFRQAFIANQQAIAKVTGLSKPSGASDRLIANLPTYLNALVLTQWFSALAKENPGLWEKMVALKFNEESWSLRIPNGVKNFTMELAVEGEERKSIRLTEKTRNLLHAVGVGELADDLDPLPAKGQTHRARQGMGDFVYSIGKIAAETTVKAALDSVLSRLETVRSFTDLRGAIRSLSFLMTHPEGPNEFSLEGLEPENLMDGLNRILSITSIPQWRRIRHLLFDVMRLHELSPTDRGFLLNFFEKDPELQSKVTILIDSVPLILDLDRVVVADSPSALEGYHHLLTRVPSASMHSMTATLQFLSLGFFSSETKDSEPDKTIPAYPAVYAFFSKGQNLSRALFFLAGLSPRATGLFLSPLQNITDGEEGTRTHLKVFQELLQNQSAGIASLIDSFGDDGFRPLEILNTMSPTLRLWLIRAAAEGDFDIAWNFLKARGTAKRFLKVTTELETLSANGGLKEALNLLKQVRDARFEKTVQVLSEAEQSGELLKVLRGFHTVLEPLAH